MELHFTAVYRIHGLNLPDGYDEVLVCSSDHCSRLVRDPNPYLQHVDISTAIGVVMVASLAGKNDPRPFRGRLDDIIASYRAQREEEHKRGAFLVFEGFSEEKTPNFSHRRDEDGLSFCFDAFDKQRINEYFERSLQASLAAVTVALDDQADRTVARISAGSWLVEKQPDKAVYSLTMTASGHISLSRAITEGFLKEARMLATSVVADAAASKAVDLLTLSQSKGTDQFQSFFAAWTALELFISSTFRSTYGRQWFSILAASVAPAASSYFDDLEKALTRHHNILDKFTVLASLLNRKEAEADILTFKRIKGIRDELAHGALGGKTDYPTVDVQRLLNRYLKLHLIHGK